MLFVRLFWSFFNLYKFSIAWCVLSVVHTNRLCIFLLLFSSGNSIFFPCAPNLTSSKTFHFACFSFKCPLRIRQNFCSHTEKFFDASDNVSVNCFILVINGMYACVWVFFPTTVRLFIHFITFEIRRITSIDGWTWYKMHIYALASPSSRKVYSAQMGIPTFSPPPSCDGSVFHHQHI